MATCANCGTDVKYEYRVTTGLTIGYCESHLPNFLLTQKRAGLLTPAVVIEEPPVADSKSKKKVAVPVEEASTEEAPTGE